MKRLLLAVAPYSLVALCTSVGCGLVTVKQDPYSKMTINADAPAPPPPRQEEKRVEVTESSIVINEKIQFAFDSAVIEEASFDLLNEIAEVMQANTHITKVQVEGHTDSTGGAGYNKKLSNQRAKSVVAYLTKAGVDKSRMVSKGFGLDKPIASNDTDEGKEANRRVEFNILEQSSKEDDGDDGGDAAEGDDAANKDGKGN